MQIKIRNIVDECHEIEQCQIASKERVPCPSEEGTNDHRYCKWLGCCFDETEEPQCYRAKGMQEIIILYSFLLLFM